jgi:hypothetical protein
MSSVKQNPGELRRDRKPLKTKGLRRIHLWAPDVTLPHFQEELRRQLVLIENADEDLETLEFIEKAADWSD